MGCFSHLYLWLYNHLMINPYPFSLLTDVLAKISCPQNKTEIDKDDPDAHTDEETGIEDKVSYTEITSTDPDSLFSVNSRDTFCLRCLSILND